MDLFGTLDPEFLPVFELPHQISAAGRKLFPGLCVRFMRRFQRTAETHQILRDPREFLVDPRRAFDDLPYAFRLLMSLPDEADRVEASMSVAGFTSRIRFRYASIRSPGSRSIARSQLPSFGTNIRTQPTAPFSFPA